MAYRRGGPLIPKSNLFTVAAKITFWCIFPIAYVVDWIFYRVRIKGRWKFQDYVAKSKSKAIIVSNHTTTLDPVKMSAIATPFTIRHTSLEATMCVPFLGTLIQLLFGMPIPSARYGKEHFIEGIKSGLKGCKAVHIYPEGMCYIQNGEVAKFHTGAFIASKELNIPIFPVATVFTEPKKILGWKSVRPRATLYVLDPIYPDKFDDVKEYAEYTHDLIQNEIYARGGTNAYSKGEIPRMKSIAKQVEIGENSLA